MRESPSSPRKKNRECAHTANEGPLHCPTPQSITSPSPVRSSSLPYHRRLCSAQIACHRRRRQPLGFTIDQQQLRKRESASKGTGIGLHGTSTTSGDDSTAHAGHVGGRIKRVTHTTVVCRPLPRVAHVRGGVYASCSVRLAWCTCIPASRVSTSSSIDLDISAAPTRRSPSDRGRGSRLCRRKRGVHSTSRVCNSCTSIRVAHSDPRTKGTCQTQWLGSASRQGFAHRRGQRGPAYHRHRVSIVSGQQDGVCLGQRLFSES